MASLALASIALTYPNGTRAVDAIDLSIADGQFLAILGPSGCGKSSLLRLVAGLESPTSGTIAMDGRDVTRLEPKDRDVAMVFQGLALYPHMTVAENMGLGLTARRVPTAEVARSVGEAAETLGLTRYLAKRPRELSGGERQLAMIARALAQGARALVLDEPTASLDFGNQVRVLREIRRLAAQGYAIVFSTHDPGQAFLAASRVLLLAQGGARRQGTPAEVITADNLRDVYGVEVRVAALEGVRVCMPVL